MADKAESSNVIVETLKTVVYALLIAGVFRSFLFQPFWIPSGSMKDTLLIGDFLFVNKMAYGYSQYSCEVPLVRVSFCPFIGERWFGSEPERGDIVVFRHPTNGQDFIKRLVGLPGDKVQMKDGALHINGTVAPQTPDGVFEEINDRQGPQGRPPACKNNVGFGGVCEKDRFIETLPGGVSHSILNVRDTRFDDTLVFTVPEGEYFFVGDNRDNSVDSRETAARGGVGFVPYENLIGRANRVVFSSGGRSLFFVWTWRLDRFFKRLD